MGARIFIILMMLALFFLAGCSSLTESEEERNAKEGFVGPGMGNDGNGTPEPELFHYKKTF